MIVILDSNSSSNRNDNRDAWCGIHVELRSAVEMDAPFATRKSVALNREKLRTLFARHCWAPTPADVSISEFHVCPWPCLQSLQAKVLEP